MKSSRIGLLGLFPVRVAPINEFSWTAEPGSEPALWVQTQVAFVTCTHVRADNNCTREPVSHGHHVLPFRAIPNRFNPNTTHQQLDQLALSLEGQRLV
jgi:hypothetical protein